MQNKHLPGIISICANILTLLGVCAGFDLKLLLAGSVLTSLSLFILLLQQDE